MGHPRYQQQQQYPQYPQAGPQYPPQYQPGPEDGAAKGNYAPAPYPAGAYQAQPVPGYAPGHYPAGQPNLASKHNSGGCCNIQWVLFAFGWVTGIAWIFGLLAPLCNTQRLKNSSYKIGWLANTLMSIVVIAVGITMIYYWTDICDRNPSWSYKCQNRA
ncbi:hypothetical protein CVIRNUC_005627 [Coccomyxa viridis]|uniref:Uncharacterized protein n=1 Tax=Coccomyxa viridis TaxID=1274662 RepID=A0AAV1I518_9CHLO|nr:hypothetical protein CVIRNUC_005627 [Coccomyxa viridis]